MPINIPDNLPAKEVLLSENIFVMTNERAVHQDIRPLKIGILNLMPTKITTETQILRLIGNTPIQVDTVLIRTKDYISKNTSEEHLKTFYHTFDEVKGHKFDGFIITGAPVEHLDFENVDYWRELKQIMEWTTYNVYSTIHICWGAQAGLYYHFGIRKYNLEKKLSGIFLHKVSKPNSILLRGFDDIFYAPHSRYTDIVREDVEKNNELDILAESDEAGIYIIKTKKGRQIFVTGHPEYDALTLKYEYLRDLSKGLIIDIPKNYFPDDNMEKAPIVKWRSHASLLYSNWLNYFVYQETPYNLDEIN